MLNDLGKQIDALQLQTFQMNQRWSMWKQLFHLSPARLDLTKKIAPDFFVQVNACFRDSVIATLCRMTDPAKQNNYDNLTLERAIKLLPPPRDPKVLRTRDAARRVLVALMPPVRRVRDKRLAHSNLETALGSQTLHLPPIEVIDRAVYCATLIVNAIEFDGASACSSYSCRGDGTSMINILHRSNCYMKHVAAGEVPFAGRFDDIGTKRRRNWWN